MLRRTSSPAWEIEYDTNNHNEISVRLPVSGSGSDSYLRVGWMTSSSMVEANSDVRRKCILLV